MIDLNATNEWQHRDPEMGLVFPWYTKSFLDELATWALSDKVILEIGGGASTLWWCRKAKSVYLVEDNGEYWNELFSRGIPNLYSGKVNPHGPFDIIIIDGEPVERRDRLAQAAIGCLKPGGRLIIDNWDQPSVGWLPNEETKALLAPYPCQIYPQEGHGDWKTAVFTKP